MLARLQRPQFLALRSIKKFAKSHGCLVFHMTTLRSEFVELAEELIGDEFADFAYDCVLINATGWNNATQTATTETQTIKAIRLDFKSSDYDGQKIMVGDYMLIAEFQPITVGLRPDSTECTCRGEVLDIKDTMIDPADATILFHVRRK